MAQETVVTTQTTHGMEISPAPKKPNYAWIIVLAILLVIGAAFAFSLRFSEKNALAKETEELAIPSVIVIQPKAEPPQQDLVLPSTLQAYTESPIYARTSGYLAKWYKDIGSRVNKGQ